jgi:hypothetical protein
MGCHLVASQDPLHQQLHFSSGGFFTKEAGVEDLGIVKNQSITRL